MPIPPDLCKVQTTFDLGPGVDIAVFGFHLRRVHVEGGVTNWPADVQVVAQKVRDAWVNSMPMLSWSTGVKAQKVDVYHLDTTGHAIDKGEAIFEGDSAWRGQDADSLPWEVALVVTLDCYDVGSYTPQRARKRGRFYLPPPSVEAAGSASGSLSGPASAGIVSGVEEYLESLFLFPLATGSAEGFEMGVLSKAASTFYPLQSARMDNQFDVQTRRQNKQSPVFTTVFEAP